MKRFVVFVWCAFAVLGAVRSASADPDVVAYAADATTVRGNWTSVSSSSGAGGRAMSSNDAGWSTTDVPLASPNDYVEFRVSASANVPYHVWMRLRAGGDSKWNDSVWVQFSDA